MLTSQRLDIKKIIDELSRQAIELQEYRGSLIQRIRADPSYKHDILDAPLTSESYWAYQRELGLYQPRLYHPNATVLDMIQKVFVAEASLYRIREKSAELAALIAPIQVIPDEILALIFETVCAPRADANKPYRTKDHRQLPPPILISSVSRKWRRVAYGMPTLWTRILLSPSYPRHWTAMALRRSASERLNVTIDCCTNTCPSSDVLDSLLAVVLPLLNRWRAFTVMSHYSDALRFVGSKLTNLRAPHLRILRLSLTGSGPPGNQAVTIPGIFLGGAPELAHVHVYSVGLLRSSSVLAGLTTIDLRWLWSDMKLSYEQFKGILSASPFLRKLVLRGLYVELIQGMEYPQLSVPSLQCLEVSGDNVSRITALLITPALEELYLANVDETEFREFMQSFESADRAKYPVLRLVHFMNVNTADPTSSFFEAISNIESLTIVHSSAGRFLHLLRSHQDAIGGHSNDIILPRLRNLTLLDDASDETLVEVVGQRAAMGYPLHRVNVNAGSVNLHYRTFLERFVKVDGIHYRDPNSC